MFADKNDKDYRALRDVLVNLHRELAHYPRADLLSIRGTAAEHQPIRMPAPPPARKREALEDGWVYLSNLPWLSGRAGWTANKDGMPRRDRDVEENRLRQSGRPYARGIGTHAPSTYKIPTCSDLAPDFRVRLVCNRANREDTIYRSKAVGEPPLMLALSAFHAIRDAIAGDQRTAPDLKAPATPESILRALRGDAVE